MQKWKRLPGPMRVEKWSIILHLTSVEKYDSFSSLKRKPSCCSHGAIKNTWKEGQFQMFRGSFDFAKLQPDSLEIHSNAQIWDFAAIQGSTVDTKLQWELHHWSDCGLSRSAFCFQEQGARCHWEAMMDLLLSPLHKQWPQSMDEAP